MDQPAVLWCLPCLRLDVQEFRPEEGEMFEISCTYDRHLNEDRCLACIPNRGRICETTPDAMEGNAYDFARRLDWLSPFFEEDEVLEDGRAISGPRYPLETRVAAAKLQKDLCRAFLHVESRHRNAHKIAGRRLFENREGAKDYNALVVQRQLDLGPIPEESTLPVLQAMFFAGGMLRLYENDVGYEEWTKAVQDFDEGLEELVGE
ncbi:hypothetical protein N7486_003993 [Penicillium sp. IBT 16267x]|nr:hypothetical protein N7486_003993 [Penicillium sp. IBT 16267x]